MESPRGLSFDIDVFMHGISFLFSLDLNLIENEKKGEKKKKKKNAHNTTTTQKQQQQQQHFNFTVFKFLSVLF